MNLNPRKRYTIQLSLTGKQWNDLLFHLDQLCHLSHPVSVARVKIKDKLGRLTRALGE